MDVFTILVFFFLVHSTNVEISTDSYQVELPQSLTNQLPRKTITVVLTSNRILLEGEPLAYGQSGDGTTKERMEALRSALQQLLENSKVEGVPQDEDSQLTIMADKSIRFDELHRVMLTCAAAGYGRILLTVIQKSAQRG